MALTPTKTRIAYRTPKVSGSGGKRGLYGNKCWEYWQSSGSHLAILDGYDSSAMELSMPRIVAPLGTAPPGKMTAYRTRNARIFPAGNISSRALGVPGSE
ncbi:MAG: hypothetical protein ABI560_02305, partial [Myxococcales bacterium]